MCRTMNPNKLQKENKVQYWDSFTADCDKGQLHLNQKNSHLKMNSPIERKYVLHIPMTALALDDFSCLDEYKDGHYKSK